MYDVAIIGAGLAGLQLARLLARGGASVFLADARRDITESVRTTGIFVRRTFEDFPVLDPFLGQSIRTIAVHSPRGQSIELEASRDEFRVGRMKELYAAMLRTCVASGVIWSPSTIYRGVSLHRDRVEVHFRGAPRVTARFLIGADGAHSRVARDLGLDTNRRWITGVEHVYRSSRGDAPRFDVWIDPTIAPGYLAWVVDDGEEVHAGVGGDRRHFDPAPALRSFKMKAFRLLPKGNPVESRGGLIPVNGVLRRIASAHGLLVGDAAGAVSPLTAGGLDACMRLSEHAADVLLRTLDGDETITAYDGARFRSRFASRIGMRTLFDVASRSTLAIELGFALGGTSAARRVIEHVFFGRGSFPDANRSTNRGNPLAPLPSHAEEARKVLRPH